MSLSGRKAQIQNSCILALRVSPYPAAKRISQAANNHSGSLSLTVLFSAFIGVTLTLLFLNLARYVGATNATEQAARRTARCLTPTDPDCVSYQSTSLESAQRRWIKYDYQSSSAIPLDYYNYSGAFIEETWRARYDTYLVHMVSPELSWPLNNVILRQYQAPANRYEQLEAQVFARAVRYPDYYPVNDLPAASPYEPLFPHWQQDRENEFLAAEISNPGFVGYEPYCRASGGSCCASATSGGDCNNAEVVNLSRPLLDLGYTDSACEPYGCGLIAPGEDITFLSREFIAPSHSPLPSSNASCFYHGQKDCGTELSVSAGEGEWRSNSYFAFRVSANICPAAGYAEVGWKNASEQEHSIQLIHSNASPGQYGGRDYLGFRDSELDSEGCRWYSIWLRGPERSHGGVSSDNYGRIAVPIGDSVRISARLKVSETHGAVEVRAVRYWAYFSGVQAEPAVHDERSCGVKTLSCGEDGSLAPHVSTSAMPELQSCGFPDAEGWVWDDPAFRPMGLSSDEDIVSVTPLCDFEPGACAVGFRSDTEELSSCSRRAAACGTSWQPKATPVQAGCAKMPSSRSYCPWGETGEETMLSVGELPQGCQAAGSSQAQERLVLDIPDEVPYSKKASLEEFLEEHKAQAEETLQTVNANIEQLNKNSLQSPSFTRLRLEDAELRQREIQRSSLHPQHPTELGRWAEYYEFSWSPVGGVEDCSGCAAAAAECESCVLQNSRDYKRWKPTEAAAEVVSATHFNISAPAGAPRYQENSLLPSAEFLSSRVQIPASPENELRTYVENVYPFEKDEEYQIPAWDCESGCTDPNVVLNKGSLEDALREYVFRPSSGAPPALASLAKNKDVFFEVKEEFVRTELLSETELPGEIPPCTPIETIKSCVATARYDLGVSEKMPPECLEDTPCRESVSGRYTCRGDVVYGTQTGVCSEELIETGIEDPGFETAIDYQAARMAGFSELKLYDPRAILGCSQGGSSSCADVEITRSGPALISIQTQYRMPLSFPLDVFLGTPHLDIVYDKEEVLEMEVVGRHVALEH